MPNYWWSQFGRFYADASGLYPQARQVVAHYRQLAGWSQEQLASRLGIKAPAQYYAEHEGRGLDSLTRLRKLRTLLTIPPTLLGLCDPPGPMGWWIKEYELWPAGPDGWPDVGFVIKSYRKVKKWTQSDLANALGIQELAVRKMEKQNTSLDSLSRRKALQFILRIPPVLLGLDAIHSNPVHPIIACYSARSALPSLYMIKETQQKLWAGYYNGHGQDELRNVNWALLQPEELLPLLPTKERGDYLEQLSLLYQGAGNITLADADSRRVLSFMNTGISLARLSGDEGLLSTALGRRAAGLYELGEQQLAERSIREALAISSKSEVVKRYPVASRVLSVSAQDKQDRLEVYSMLDNIVVNDRYQNGVDIPIVYWARAQTLLNLAEHAPDRSRLLSQASDLLERSEKGAPDTTRRKLIIRLEQARAYVERRYYDYAATLAIEAFELMRKLRSVLYICRLTEIYQKLLQSSYAGSPQVARLGLSLLQSGALE